MEGDGYGPFFFNQIVYRPATFGIITTYIQYCTTCAARWALRSDVVTHAGRQRSMKV